ncbi:MAG: hypothetical protein RLZ98_3551 [Pseudomonadota bacterium]|jgi:cell division protein FtsA
MRKASSDEILGVLDIGSSKICCLIGLVPGGPRHGGQEFRTLGFGHMRSRGIKSGIIVDLDEAERSVRAAVAQAEKEAGTQLEEVTVAVTSGRLKSLNFRAEARLNRGVVGVDDLSDLWDGAREYVERSGRALVSLNHVDYRVDGCEGIVDPRGLAGSEIVADMHAVTADLPPLRNIHGLMKRCYLDVGGLVPAAYASALAATTDDERDAGVICIDIGGGVTGIAILARGRFVHSGSIPFGAGHISLDIARDLAISFDEAERLKTLHGSVLHAASDETELVGYNTEWAGQVVRQQTVRAHVRRIVEHRLCMILQMVAEHLSDTRLGQFSRHRIVLTGGGSQLLGLAEFAANFLGRPVRTGGPLSTGFGPQFLAGPGFSSLVGTMTASQDANHLLSVKSSADRSLEASLGRVGRWLKESF